jgi:hypothetical protein
LNFLIAPDGAWATEAMHPPKRSTAMTRMSAVIVRRENVLRDIVVQDSFSHEKVMNLALTTKIFEVIGYFGKNILLEF